MQAYMQFPSRRTCFRYKNESLLYNSNTTNSDLPHRKS